MTPDQAPVSQGRARNIVRQTLGQWCGQLVEQTLAHDHKRRAFDQCILGWRFRDERAWSPLFGWHRHRAINVFSHIGQAVPDLLPAEVEIQPYLH